MKEGNDAVLTTMKMEADMIQGRRTGGIGGRRTFYKYDEVLQVNQRPKEGENGTGVLPTVLRSSATSQNRRRSTKWRNPSLVLELGFWREMASLIRRVGERMEHRGGSS
jgi:hypothetical protein